MNTHESLLSAAALADLGIGVSGGGGDLGRAIARGLAAAGATIVIFGRSEAALEQTSMLGDTLVGEIFVEVADQHRDEDLARVLDRTEKEAGRVHGWLNNACSGPSSQLMALDRGAVEDSLAGTLDDVIMATEAAAKRIAGAGQGVRVNCVSPGPFPTPSVQRDGAFIEKLEQRSPLGRIGRPDELDSPVAFLLSPLSSYVTGHNLVVDRAWTTW